MTRRDLLFGVAAAQSLRLSAPQHNFELDAEAQVEPGADASIRFQAARGFVVRISSSQPGERAKTGSLLGLRHLYKQLVADREWFRINLVVRQANAQVRLNGVLVADYTHPEPFGAGTLELHGPDAVFRGVRVKKLPDDARNENAPPPQTDALAQKLQTLAAQNYPVVDYHTHLKGGLTLDLALQHWLTTGIGVGAAVNCGLGMEVREPAGARKFIQSLQGQPVYIAMQAEGREWMDMFPRDVASEFEYIFTDSMTWTDDRGKRMRLWRPNEVGVIPDPQEFMETLVRRTVGILEREPVDIYVNPTFLPAPLDKRYDELWTDARITKVVKAAKASDIAIELNDRYKLPGERVVRAAKAEGVKFSFGTNNAGANDLGRCEYGVEMVERCKLQWSDFFVPRPKGDRAIDRRGYPSR